MNKHTTFELGQQREDFIDEALRGGDYRSPSEVVNAGLDLLKLRRAKIEALRAAIKEGEESGEPRPFDFDEFLARKHRERGV